MIEVWKQMLEVLEYWDVHGGVHQPTEEAIQAGKQAIAELESQEPLATVTSETGADITMSWWHEPALPIGTKLFTHPPQRTWVGLDHQDKKKFSSWLDHKTDDEVFTAINDLLREMNT